MIFGIGIDLAKCSRFQKWIDNPKMLERFFNPEEILEKKESMTAARQSASLQHYAARFAAKEAFSKALGCGLVFDLRDLFIQNDKNGKPMLAIQGSAQEALKKYCPDWQNAKFFVSLSHEKEFAIAQVIIEI